MTRFMIHNTPNDTWSVGVTEEFLDSIPIFNLTVPVSLLFSRILQLRYVDYWRFVRDKCGATLHGKTGYIYCDFETAEAAQKFADLLDKKYTQWEAM